MKTKILVVGGVAGGAMAAARARRIDETAESILQTPEGQRGFANVANLTGGYLSSIAEAGFAWETCT